MTLARIQTVHPVLPSRDVAAAIRFYTERLGFGLRFVDDAGAPRYAGVARDGVELHLQWHDPAEVSAVERPMLRLTVSDVDALHREFAPRGVFHDGTAVRETPWGTREFAFYDGDGNGLTFFRDLRAPAPAPPASVPAQSAAPLDRLPTLEAGEVRLRQLEDGDAPALLTIFGDPEVVRYWSSPALVDEAAARALLAEIADGLGTGRLYQWGVARRGDDVIIGTATLHRIDRVHRRAELGFALGRASWGGGIMGRALPVLIDWAFGPLGLHRLEADADPRNGASVRLLERLGFRREGFLPERWFVHGEFADTVLLGLMRPEWVNRPRA